MTFSQACCWLLDEAADWWILAAGLLNVEGILHFSETSDTLD